MGQDPIPLEHWVEPVQILYLLPLSGNGQVTLSKSRLAQESESYECLISWTFKAPGCRNSPGSPWWMTSHHPRATSSYWFDPMGKALMRLLPVWSDGESSDETVTGYFVSTEKSVKQSGSTRHLDYGSYRYHIGDQRSLRRACGSAQSHQSLRCSHTWSMEEDEGSNQKSDN